MTKINVTKLEEQTKIIEINSEDENDNNKNKYAMGIKTMKLIGD